jgi:hypothetical protein
MSSVGGSGSLDFIWQFALASANALLAHTGSQNKRASQSQQQQEPGSLPSHERQHIWSSGLDVKLFRMGRDSNPRYLAVHTLSRRAQSTALAPIQDKPETFLCLRVGFNFFSASARDPRKTIEYRTGQIGAPHGVLSSGHNRTALAF